MHRCLTIPEILLAIIDALPKLEVDLDLGLSDMLESWDDISLTPNHADARAIALTGKAFLNAGLDALWSTMNSMQPLLLLLVSEDLPGLSVEPTVTLDMTRFDYYARRIRILQTSNFDGPSLDAFRSLSVNTWHRSQSILPNLRHLEWRHIDTDTFPYISLFSGPVLQSIILFPFDWDSSHDDSFFSSLSTLSRFSPMLSRLMLHDDFVTFREDCYKQTMLFLGALPFVVSVRLCTPVSYDMIRQLNSMPNLRTLRADFYARDIEISGTVKKLNFVSLQKIELTQGELATFTSFLDMLPDGLNAETIKIEHMECEPSLAVNRLVGAVCRVCSPEALKSFNLGADGHSNYEHSSDFITNNATLSPFFKFRHIKSFSVSFGDPDWDDRLLEDIASVWPGLRHLALRRHGRKPSKLTFRGLALLAKGCPRLEDLSLSLAPWNADVCGTALGSSIKSIRLSPLHMALRYPLTNLEAEAESYLKLVFPNLSQLDIQHVDAL